ncbi:MAG: PilW family protein [Proteobacteria bacterium]|nr:PilW family protein [Pseudomonadota bacterium]
MRIGRIRLRRASAAWRSAGFSLIEILVAITLGLLVSVGLATLFQSTSASSKVETAFQHLQENGRYAITRLNTDVRMTGAPYCSNSSGPATVTTNGATDLPIATSIYAPSLTLPDVPSGLAAMAAAPTGWPTGAGALPYPLSPSVNLQGYECDLGGTSCASPAPSFLPAQGITAGLRVPGTDALTIRYLQGTGWPLTASSVPVAGTCAITATRSDPDPAFNFAAGNNVFIGICNNPLVAAAPAGVAISGNTATATLTGLTANSAGCAGWPVNVTRVYNYSTDFVAATYYLQYNTDPNTPGRVVPGLVRRVNGVDSVIASGVEKLDFLYGVADANGNVAYMTADKVNTRNGGAIACPAPSVQFTNGGVTLPDQTGCLWRAVKSIEVHMLVDTVNNVYPIGSDDKMYCYSIDPTTSLATVDCTDKTKFTAPPATDAGGLPSSMMRREFVSLIGVRRAAL